MSRLHGKDRGLFERPLDSGVWWVRIWDRGKEIRYKVGNKTLAGSVYKKIKTEQAEGRFFPERYRVRGGISLSEAIESYLAESVRRYKRSDEAFKSFWLGNLGNVSINTLNTPEIEAGIGQLGEKRLSHATINRYLSFLKAVLNTAVRKGQLMRSPALNIKPFKEKGARLRFLTADEEETLKKAFPAKHWPAVQLALHTGMRQMEQFSMKWNQIDLKNRVLTLTQTKSGKIRHIPLNENAVIALQCLANHSEWVFPSRQNKSSHVNPVAFYNHIFKSAVKESGLTGIVWHTLRHTFASRLVMAGVDLRTVQELMGHHSISMTMKYAHLGKSHVREAVGRIATGT